MKTDAKNPPMAPGKIRRSRTREVAAEVVRFEPPQVTAEIRERKLARVRWAIESGTYQVSAEKIADKMIGGGVLDDVLAPQVF
ncbi:MAG: hypothetical protein DMG07_01000 [Acidobacteria bacterium]|nr:MAG: hypothetical protein DMG07_01000 [Acidobacteriota bacterium]